MIRLKSIVSEWLNQDCDSLLGGSHLDILHILFAFKKSLQAHFAYWHQLSSKRHKIMTLVQNVM